MNNTIKKNIIGIKTITLSSLLIIISLFSCTSDFEEFNKNPNLPTNSEAKNLIAGVQYNTFAEPRFISWRGNLLYSSQFANQFTTNVNGSWWAGGDAYGNNQGWTNNVFDQPFKKSGLNLRALLIKYMDQNDTNGQAVTKIMMDLFHQKMTDIFGNIPYSEVTIPQIEVLSPKYNTQKAIYTLILIDLKAQMDLIGSSTKVIQGSEGDFIYQGDPQKWKALANTLRLRMALRSRDAFNADGENAFIDAVINDCLSNPLIDGSNEATFERSRSSLINANLDGGFEDVYWGFGGRGSKWILTERYISLLRDNNDPRLTEIATEAENGGYKGGYANLRTAPVWEDMSKPSKKIVGTSTDAIQDQVSVMILTAAESHFLQAEAALLGYSGNANTSYQNGILASINFWGTTPGNFITNEAIATLSGSNQNMLKQVYDQRWIASLTNGYESWSLVRRTNLIPQLTNNTTHWVSQPNNGNVPKRLPYSTTEITSNAANINAAILHQGDDLMTTALWWDKN
ncbi:SusD/RagB family nutrient-binding outer membrane lipoprotein [Tenacibaculum sp.]|nr:SusD/RagB family nutrient-binding outer membrane lipoprotein [Tenacibaculum sp.]